MNWYQDLAFLHSERSSTGVEQHYIYLHTRNEFVASPNLRSIKKLIRFKYNYCLIYVHIRFMRAIARDYCS